jgi:hypothetical protein
MDQSAATLLQRVVPTEMLRTVIEQAIGRNAGAWRQVEAIDRRPSDYSSSFAMEELDVHLAGGARLELMFKNLSWHSLLADARRARPAFLYDPCREIRTYQQILAGANLGTPLLYGALADRAEGSYFLFMERVRAPKLCHVGDFSVWKNVARWLARMHAHFAGRAESFERPGHLLKYDARHYRLWINRACSFFHNARSPDADAGRRAIEWLASRYEPVVETLAAQPRTLIHGEFYASNILADDAVPAARSAPRRVCPVDWEMAALGPGMIDLAALVAGSWTDEKRLALARTYYAAAPRTSWRDFLHLLDCCRLHLAVQYVGWATEWSPPSDQKQDWLSEAIMLAKKLQL